MQSLLPTIYVNLNHRFSLFETLKYHGIIFLPQKDILRYDFIFVILFVAY